MRLIRVKLPKGKTQKHVTTTVKKKRKEPAQIRNPKYLETFTGINDFKKSAIYIIIFAAAVMFGCLLLFWASTPLFVTQEIRELIANPRISIQYAILYTCIGSVLALITMFFDYYRKKNRIVVETNDMYKHEILGNHFYKINHIITIIERIRKEILRLNFVGSLCVTMSFLVLIISGFYIVFSYNNYTQTISTYLADKNWPAITFYLARTIFLGSFVIYLSTLCYKLGIGSFNKMGNYVVAHTSALLLIQKIKNYEIDVDNCNRVLSFLRGWRGICYDKSPEAADPFTNSHIFNLLEKIATHLGDKLCAKQDK